ncbi:MAG: MFS transporter [Bacteroidaceae bacterium]|nr:MFS transporter [Bacteroidaceae bacterium]
MKLNRNTTHPASWVPSLYFAEALPYMMVMVLSTVMYTNMGLSNTEIALYTSWLYLPWVIKPLWSPIVDSLKTKRWWILVMQILVGAALAGVALTLQTEMWLQLSLAFFWLMAFSSATHDIAADGFYIIGLTEKEQAFYVGWRSTFYRIGTIFCQGGLVFLAGILQQQYPSEMAWGMTMGLGGVIMLALVLWHAAALPKAKENTDEDQKRYSDEHTKNFMNTMTDIVLSFWKTLIVFFHKKGIWPALLFMLLFRFPEAQLAKMAQPFMLRSTEEGGLALATETVGVAYGTIGVIGLLLGGILGGWLVSRDGMKKWWWPMIAAISLPDAVYIYLSIAQPTSMWIINSCVAVEQLGYGFGFTAYMLFLVYFSKGERSTSVFSICTAFQALGMMLPGMIAGYLADQWGFTNFFWWVMACCLVTVVVSGLVKLEPSIGQNE